MQVPEIHIVVVHSREGDSVRRCLASLANLNYPDDKLAITVLDNGVQENGLAFVSSEFPNARVLVNGDRTYSWIPGLAGSMGKTEHLAIISAEIMAGKDLFNELISSMGDNEAIAAVKGRVVLHDGAVDQARPGEVQAADGFEAPVLYRYGVLKDLLSQDEYGSLHMEDVDLVGLLSQHDILVVKSPRSIAYAGPDAKTVETELFHDGKKGRGTEVINEYVDKSCKEPSTTVIPTLLEQGRNGLDSVVSDIVWKMQSEEDAALLKAVLPGVFDGMQKVLGLEKDYLSSKIEVLEKEIENKDSYLEEQRETTKTLTKAVNLIKSTNEENAEKLSEKSTEINRLKERLAEEEEERDREYSHVCERDKLIREKDRMVKFMEEELRGSRNEVKEKAEEAEALSKQISEIYSSETYRLLAKPLWKILKITRPITGNKLFFSMAVLFGALIFIAALILLMGIEWGLLAERIADFGMQICNRK